MNWLDVVLLIILAASMVTSFRKGLSREVIGSGSVVWRRWCWAIWFYGTAGSSFCCRMSVRRGGANFCGFLMVFFAVVLLWARWWADCGKIYARSTGLSFVDHALGAGFGVRARRADCRWR